MTKQKHIHYDCIVAAGTLIRKKANQFLDEQINSIPAK